jgi:FlgD Ig-like domain
LARLIATLLVLGLLGGSAAAFAVTEELKLERSPITGTRIPTEFSPVCGCRLAVAHISFKLRKPDSVTAEVLESDGDPVARIADGRNVPKGNLTLTWNGRNQAGGIVPEGGYKVRVHLAHRHETITIPNTIQVDMTPPKITLVRVTPRNRTFSPDHDGRRDRIAIKFDVSEVARPLLYVNGRLVIRGRLTHVTGVLYWSGRLEGRKRSGQVHGRKRSGRIPGHKLPPGTYRLSLRGQDVAGNRGPPTHPHFVVLRYLSVLPQVAHTRPGHGFTIVVSSDARRIAWRVDGKRGEARPGRISLKAPKRHGRYRIVFTTGGHRAFAHVVVRGKK